MKDVEIARLIAEGWIICINIMIIITAYTAAFPQSGSSSAGIRVISASDN